MTQVADYPAAADLPRRPDPRSTPRRLGVFGSGGTGGGNAIMVAAGLDARIRRSSAQVPVVGRPRLAAPDAPRARVAGVPRVRQGGPRAARRSPASRDWCRRATGSWCPPRSARPPPSRATWTTACPSGPAGARAEAIFAYRPIDVVERIAPRALMLIAVEHDATTPEDHAYAMYERATGPKRLVIQTGTTHYAAYAQYRAIVNPRIVEWFRRYLVAGEVVIHEDADGHRHHLPVPAARSWTTTGRRGMTPVSTSSSAAAPWSQPRDASSRTSPSPTSASRRSWHPGTDAAGGARHRRHRQAPAAGRHRRPLAPPRAGLHPQGGHRHAPRPRVRRAASRPPSRCPTWIRRPTPRSGWRP